LCDEKLKNGHTKGDTLKKVSSFLFLRKAGKSMSDMKSEKEKAEAEEHRDERIEKTDMKSKKEYLQLTAMGTPMEWLPPRTRDTVGLLNDASISAMASPASTSPPIVFNSTSTPPISSLSSIAAS